MNSEICESAHRGRPLVPLEEAREALLSAAALAGSAEEIVPLTAAVGRVLAEEIALDRAEPPVPRSAMDGFAVRSADQGPRQLLAPVYAGTVEIPTVGAGQAAAVMTGGTVAPGADAVVPVERSRVAGDQLFIDGEVLPGQHIRQAGEMGAAGRVILHPGRRLRPQDLAAAAGCGHDPVRVRTRPRVALLSTGDEVIGWNCQPGSHQVRDSNRLGAAQMLQQAGAEIVLEEHVLDRPDALEDAVRRALALADLVITIGGVSMGDKDHLPGVFTALAVERLFHGVSVQPGKPVWAGRHGRTFVLGLPGNPVSSAAVLALLGRPLLAALAGRRDPDPRPLMAMARCGAVARARKRERYLPARLEGSGTALTVSPCAESGSGDWTSLATAEVLLRIPPDTTLQVGDPAEYLEL